MNEMFTGGETFRYTSVNDACLRVFTLPVRGGGNDA